MSIQRKTPRKVTVTPPDPKYTEQDIRKQQLRVAPYCRVSTGNEEQLTSFTAQMEYYTQRIAETEGWTMARMYADKGISGTSAKRRPEFLKMIRDAEQGKIDLVITKSVSRFCRNTLDGLEYVRRLKRCGVGVYFEKDHTNTLTMDNEMILTFLMSQAQSESESMSTNIKWGFRKRFQDGVVYYHYGTLLGYRRGPDGGPEIDPEEAAGVRRIFARCLMGQSFQQICDGLMADGVRTAQGDEKWYGSTVKSILQNEKYVGDAVLQKTFTEDLFDRRQVKNEGQLPKYYVHNAHPAIIDRAAFQLVQEELARRSSLRKTSSKARTEQGKHSGKYVLSGLLVCSECGSPYRRITYMPDGQKRFVWRCLNRIEHGKRICKHSATVDEQELQAAVTAALNGMLRQREARDTLADCVASALAGTGDDSSLPNLESQLRALQGRQMELLQLAMGDTRNTGFDEELIRINAAITELLARKTKLEREGGADPVYDGRVQAITGVLERTDSAITGFDDGIVFQMISRVTVLDKERLCVRFKDGTEIEQTVEHMERRDTA